MRKLVLVLALSAVALAPAAWADTVYTSSADFYAAISGLSQFTEDYGSGYVDGQAIPNGFNNNGITYQTFNLTQGATQGDITNLYNSFTGLSLGADHRDLGDAFTYFLGGEGATLVFDQPVIAFGMFFNANLDTGTYGFTYAGGSAYNDSTSYDQATFIFVGVVADSPFTSVTFNSTDEGLGVYNVPAMTYALQQEGVPEPSSLVLLGTSLVGAFGVVRRRVKL